jgi:succinyl-diaminopimelate desuccinylase
MTEDRYLAIDQWIDAHINEEVGFLQQLVRVPTDTPPGNNAPHAERTAELLGAFGFVAERHPVPAPEVRAAGLGSITNLIVRRRYGAGRTIALNAHGDVVPPGEGWTRDPYGGEVVDGRLYGRAAAVSKCDFATFTFATRAIEALEVPLQGSVELHFTYDEEFGGELGPGWLLDKGLTRPDLLIAAELFVRRLQLPGRHRAQRLPAARGHGARQDGPCRGPRHGMRCAASRDPDPQRTL